jgi:hypothetical protein
LTHNRLIPTSGIIDENLRQCQRKISSLLSTGSVSAIQRQVSEALAASVDHARSFVRQQKAQHVDETGWREAGRLKWLWVNATAEVTAFEVLDGRGVDGAMQMIRPVSKGVVTTDRFWSYNWLSGLRRQVAGHNGYVIMKTRPDNGKCYAAKSRYNSKLDFC